MDPDRFDALARTVFASSRRGLLGALVAGTLSRLSLAQTAAQTECQGVGRSCGAGAECCSKLCTGTCVCRAIGEGCAADANCCIGRCRGGVCRCTQNASCPNGAHCCGDGLCHECCTDEHCPGSEHCCQRSELNICVASECGQDRDCPAGHLCEACTRCVCDLEQCGNSRLNGCCGDGRCRSGTEMDYCGKPGTECDTCVPEAAQKCDPKTRRCVCDQQQCRVFNGCCDTESAFCDNGNRDTACGDVGQICKDCTKKGAGWVCRNQRCCKEAGACPDNCPRNGACKACCGGQCAGGKCRTSCSSQECNSGQLCCNDQCVNQTVDNNCGECGKRCNDFANPARADSCVNGQCKCGSSAPCDCTKGTICEGGTCVCDTFPGRKACQWDDNPCTYHRPFIFEPCPEGSTEVCQRPA